MEQTGVVQDSFPATTRIFKHILFATVPADGHFSPLTGLAVHLKSLGHDVRWYTSNIYADKLSRLRIPHYSFKKALDVNAENVEAVFPERKHIRGVVKKLNFDLVNGFMLRSVEYFADIKVIHQTFAFDLVICDCLFTAIPFIKEKMHIPVVSIGVFPLSASSRDLPPAGLGLTPSTTLFGRHKQDLLRFITDKVLFGKSSKLMRELLHQHGIEMTGKNIFDMLVRKSTLLLQSGTPGFEYKRSDLGSNIRFVGALLPYNATPGRTWYHEKIKRYEKVILVTQGTVEKDISKLLVPALEAFKNSTYLLIATTGGSRTAALREQYKYDNIIIEDFIPFADVMPYAHVYITNGGYGGIMLSIQNKLPMVAAGKHEGKNEITARVGYFKLGINLKTEKPSSVQLKAAVERIFSDDSYLYHVKKTAKEFNAYNTHDLCVAYINEALQTAPAKISLAVPSFSDMHLF